MVLILLGSAFEALKGVYACVCVLTDNLAANFSKVKLIDLMLSEYLEGVWLFPLNNQSIQTF